MTVAFAAAASGCGPTTTPVTGTGPTTTVVVTDPVTTTSTTTANPGPYDGAWVGVSSQDEEVLFTIESSRLTALKLRVRSTPSCRDPVTFVLSANLTDPKPLTGSEVETTMGAGDHFAASFSSPTDASGTIEVVRDAQCTQSIVVTWSATRQ